MLRITVFGNGTAWSFCPGATADESWASAYKATQAAVAYGDTLEGKNLGYIIRLLAPGNENVSDTITLETRVFDPRPATLAAAWQR